MKSGSGRLFTFLGWLCTHLRTALPLSLSLRPLVIHIETHRKLLDRSCSEMKSATREVCLRHVVAVETSSRPKLPSVNENHVRILLLANESLKVRRHLQVAKSTSRVDLQRELTTNLLVWVRGFPSLMGLSLPSYWLRFPIPKAISISIVSSGKLSQCRQWHSFELRA